MANHDLPSRVAEQFGISAGRVHVTGTPDVPPPPPLNAKAKEKDVQRLLVKWAWNHPDTRLHLLRSIGNDGRRVFAKGRVPGTPDLLLPVPSGSFGALWLELKRPSGDLSDNQHDQMQALERFGHAVDVAWTPKQGAFVLRNYLYDPASFLSGW